MAAKFDEQRAASSFVFVHGSEIDHRCIAYRLSSSVGVVVCCLSRKLR